MIRFVSFVSHAERIWGDWDRQLTANVVADGLRVIAAWLVLAVWAVGRAAVATYHGAVWAVSAYRTVRRVIRRQWRVWAVAGAAGAYEAALRRLFCGRQDAADKVIIRAAYLWQECTDIISTIRPVFTANSVALTVGIRTIRLVQVAGRQVYVMGQLMA